MDATEAAALARLGERDKWPVNELPADIDADMLRCLDMAELVESASVVLVNQQKHPGDTTPPAESQGRWFSPMKQPEMAGGWDRIRSAPPLGTEQPERSRVDVKEVPRDDFGGFFPRRSHRIVSLWVPKPTPSFFVRLTERGRAELSRLRRRGAASPYTEAYEEGRACVSRTIESITPAGAHLRRSNAAESADPHPGDDLLRFLTGRPDERASIQELPERLRDPNALTASDADGLIEFGTRNHCFVGPDHELRVEGGWDFGSITGPDRKPMRTFLAEAVNFDGDDRIRPHVRLTAEGRDRAARLAVTTSDGSSNPVSRAPGVREVQRQLLEMCDAGERYTSVRDLMRRVGCGSTSTVSNAINGSKTLQAWRDRDSRNPRPRAASITEIVTDNIAQRRESDPAKDAEGADWEIEFARLIQDAQPDERAKLNALEHEQRMELVAMVRDDPDRYDRLMGREP